MTKGSCLRWLSCHITLQFCIHARILLWYTCVCVGLPLNGTCVSMWVSLNHVHIARLLLTKYGETIANHLWMVVRPILFSSTVETARQTWQGTWRPLGQGDEGQQTKTQFRLWTDISLDRSGPNQDCRWQDMGRFPMPHLQVQIHWWVFWGNDVKVHGWRRNCARLWPGF